MDRRVRLGLATASGLVLVYVAAALIAPRLIDAERFRPRLEARLTELLGKRVTMGGLALTLWRGLAIRVKGLRIDEPGSSWELDASWVRVRPALWPLIHGDPQIDSWSIEEGLLRSGSRVILRNAKILGSLRRMDDGSSQTKGRLLGVVEALPRAPKADVRFTARVKDDRLELDAITGSLGAIVMEASGDAVGLHGDHPRLALRWRASAGSSRAEGEGSIEFQRDRPQLAFRVLAPWVDFDELLRLSGGRHGSERVDSLSIVPAAYAGQDPPAVNPATLFERALGQGSLRAERGRFAGLEMTSLSARVSLEKGVVRFDDAVFDLYGGRNKARFDVDLLRAAMPFVLAARVEGVDAGPVLVALAPAYGRSLEGRATLSIDLVGEAAGFPKSLQGSGRLEVKNGVLSSVGLLKQAARVLQLAGGRGIGTDTTPFDRLSASFRLSSGRARSEELVFRSVDLDLDGGGEVGVDGSLALGVVASFSKPASDDLVRNTPQLKFRVGHDGRVTVPLKIGGNIRSPEVQLDLDRVLREGLNQSLRDKTKKGLLKKLLGFRKD